MKHRALQRANNEIAIRFVNDPCFRIGPNGSAYQIPLPDCNDTGRNTDFGDPSPIRPEEYGLSKCLDVVGGEIRSQACTTGYAGQKWRLEAVLDAAQNPVPDGRVRIVDEQTGQCLRLGADPDWQALPNWLLCARVPWTTKLTMGACSGAISEFFVVPWTPMNTVPGTSSPDAWDRWRIRPALQCTDLYGHLVSWDGDSCVDANATGDGVLRVFWCHDSPRQQFRAEQWY